MNEPLQVPEWLVVLVGRLVIENEAMRQALATRERVVNGGEPERDRVTGAGSPG